MQHQPKRTAAGSPHDGEIQPNRFRGPAGNPPDKVYRLQRGRKRTDAPLKAVRIALPGAVKMSVKIERHQEDSETLFRLLRQSIQVTEALAQPEYPLTGYLLRVAISALEEEMRDKIKAEALSDMHYT